MHYKTPDNSLHYLSDVDIANGGEALLPTGCIQITDEEAAVIRLANTPPLTVRQQISALEATITPRRMRESVLGTDGGWLAHVDAQIAALRGRL